ncbi:Bug family tripartite tricarboxylate transporter substrate binding protein [Pseudonocardia adelaidensis]|uniref:Tripartite tricarboxylate transporter substrate binding protein n=1 Tax=Pseudonocardia adelaidensis TaxID=648754 RepID=A0ABP9NPR3_9PSEU
MRWSKVTSVGAMVCVAGILAGCQSAGRDGLETASYPAETLEFAIPGGPGGGNDIMVRTLVRILEDEGLYGETINPTNRQGAAGGTTAYQDLLAAAGDPYQISSTSSSFITTPLVSEVGWTTASFTPVALLAQDDSLIVTKSGEGLDTWQDWVTHATANGSVTVGGIATGADFVRQVSLAEQAGYEIDYVPFNEDGELINGLLSDSVDAIIASPGDIVGQVEAGNFEAILWTGPHPLADLPDVPSANAAGLHGLPGTPRGLILPPGVPAEVVAWWEQTIKIVVETEAWAVYLAENRLTADARYGDDFGAFLAETSGEFERIMREHGAL